MPPLTGHNTKMSARAYGCRMPFECPGTEKGYAGAGPVKTYTLSPEEIAAKYGPPKPRIIRGYDAHITRGSIIRAIEASETYDEAAELLGWDVNRLKREIRFQGIKPKLKEAKNVTAFMAYQPTKKRGGQPKQDTTQDTGNASSGEQSDGGNTNTLPEANAQPHGANMEAKDELLPFIVPRKPVKDQPTLKFDKRGISLNTFALRAMAGLRQVQITTYRRGGKIVLVPWQVEGSACYELGQTSGGSSLKIGGGSLVKALLERGIEYGKYRLTYNNDRNWWETGEIAQ